MSPISCTEEKAQHRLLINLHKFNATRRKNAQLYNQAKVFARQKTIMQAQGSTYRVIVVTEYHFNPETSYLEEFRRVPNPLFQVCMVCRKPVWLLYGVPSSRPKPCETVQFFFFPLNLKDVQVMIIAKYNSNPYHN